MKANQTSTRAGIEDFLCCFTSMYITQGSNGEYSHKGTMANDVRGKKAGYKYPYYAPCTVKCIKTYPESGQVMWQSVNKVRFANGRIDYATFMTAHDDTMDAVAGKTVVNQGSQLGNMGTKGNATGVHCHIQISQSKTTSWTKNKYGIYQFPNEYDTDACYFMDGTEILNGMGGNWKYLKDVPVEEPKPAVDEDKVKIQELENKIKELEKAIEVYEKDKITSTVMSAEQEQTIENLKKELATLENRIVEVTTERDKLKQEQPTLIFTAKRSDKYIINLYKDEKLYIK